MSAVTFYYDFSSPYSYLGATQIERVASSAGATVDWRPMLLGGLFKALGTANVPLLATVAAQRRYLLRDVQHWADHWGVALRWPSRFPMNTVAALRLVLVADAAHRPRLSHALYRAYWVEDRDLADRAVLADVASAVGLDGAALVERTSEPAIKAALIANTDEALARGVFGLPSFFVGGELFFGQDRLDFVAAALEAAR